MHDRLKATFLGIIKIIVTAVVVTVIVFGIFKAATPNADYISWLRDISRGDFGYSYRNSEPVLRAILQRLSPTLELILIPFIITGIVCALFSTWLSRPIVRNVILVLNCIPFFWLAIAVQIVLSVRGPFPTSGYASSGVFWMTHLSHLVLPVCVLVLFLLPTVAEYFRERLTTSSNRRVQSNRIIAGLVFLFADKLPEIISAAIITEVVFAWPGEGRLLFDALMLGDRAVLVGFLLFNALVVLVVRLGCEAEATRSFTDEAGAMSKRAIAMAVLAAFALFLLSLSGSVMKYANSIDTAHFAGYALPPCFLDAKACAGHLLGTDVFGRDLLARLVVGARATIGLSLFAVIFELALGSAFGAMVRYGGAFVRFLVMRLADALLCFPVWPFILVVTMTRWPGHPPGPSLGVLVALTAIFFAPRIMRLVGRGETQHNVMRSLFNQARRDWAHIILLLATVDFFGYGVQPPTPSWGNMLSSLGENFFLAWWNAVFPAVCIFIIVILMEIPRRTFLTTVLVK